MKTIISKDVKKNSGEYIYTGDTVKENVPFTMVGRTKPPDKYPLYCIITDTVFAEQRLELAKEKFENDEFKEIDFPFIEKIQDTLKFHGRLYLIEDEEYEKLEIDTI